MYLAQPTKLVCNKCKKENTQNVCMMNIVFMQTSILMHQDAKCKVWYMGSTVINNGFVGHERKKNDNLTES